MARRHREFAGTLDKRHTKGAPVRLRRPPARAADAPAMEAAEQAEAGQRDAAEHQQERDPAEMVAVQMTDQDNFYFE